MTTVGLEGGGVSAIDKLNGQKVLVTGASGFIGSSLLHRLSSSAVEVHAVSRKTPICDPGRTRWWVGDLTELSTVRQLLGDIQPQVVLHLASHVAGGRGLELVRPTFDSNLLTTVNVLTTATEAGCRRVVLAGSLEEPTEADGIPCSPYAAAKHAASAYARMFHALYGLPVVVLRLFMVYGPGQRDLRKLVPYVILSLLGGKSPRLMSGDRAVDWIFVEDVVDALLSAAAAPDIGGRTLDVGSGRLLTVRRVVEELVRLVNPRIQPDFGAIADRPLEQIRRADPAPTTALTGWRPSTRLEDGLKVTVEWYAEQFASGAR